jgi:4-amino-4-deoxy-L-arabinose transferase-like glycosyltransferase
MPSSPLLKRQYWAVVLLLLAFLLIRLHALGAFPLFIDEAMTIDWAKSTFAGKPLLFAEMGRVLPSWWMAIFQPSTGSIWIGRASQILISLIGAASAYRLARRSYSHHAGIIAVILLTFSPILFFYERLIIADAIGGAISVVVLAFVISPRWKGQLISALALFAAILARVTLITLLPLPFLAWLLFRSKGITIRRLASTYGVTAAVTLPTLVFFRARGQDYLSHFSVHGSGVSGDTLQLIAFNTGWFFRSLGAYFSPPGLIVLVILLIYGMTVSRRALLIAISLLPLSVAVIVFGKDATVRYIVAVIAPMLVLAAVGLAALADRLTQLSFPAFRTILPAAVIGTWAVFFALPFIVTGYNAPAELPLATTDRQEYIGSAGSGFGLPELALTAGRLAQQDNTPLTLVGWHSNCVGLSFYVPKTVNLECPIILWTGASTKPFSEDLQKRLANKERILVVSEDLPYLPDDALPANRKVVWSFARPDNLSTLRLWAFR